jgi:preprotein translocase subunit SecA
LKSGISHNVLNAKKHDEESAIIAWAGSLGAVTIATNMAGRGVDIKLGGEIAEEILAAVNRVLRRAGHEDPANMSVEERIDALGTVGPDDIGIYGSEIEQLKTFMANAIKVREVGGLHVLGSERHDSRRIDNQLRGRAARQGDAGSSQFFLSLEDELMRLFGGIQVSNLMQRLNIDDSVPIGHSIVNRTIEQAQTRVEGANFDTRKHLLDYDDVLNQQREVFYNQRNRIFTKDDLSEDIASILPGWKRHSRRSGLNRILHTLATC